MSKKYTNSIHWFRKGLRLHDNPALIDAVQQSKRVYPIFILDASIKKFMKVGANRWRFLIQSLTDLDLNLRSNGLRLLVIRGNPIDVFSNLIKKWDIDLITYEFDTEPFARERDEKINKIAKKLNVNIITKISHTLYNAEQVLAFSASHKTPFTYQGFLSTVERIGKPSRPKEKPDFSDLKSIDEVIDKEKQENYSIPTLNEVNVNEENDCGPCLYPGGETEALKRLNQSLENERWVCTFAKPDTSPNSLRPSTTVLSPYLKFGCLSCRLFYYKLIEIESRHKSKVTKPPVSLIGQLMWREFFYANAALTPNFDKMIGNHVCKQISWSKNENYLNAWKYGQTGYPFIDAIMTQLRTEGWIHHLARHAVACFLTRGDLWISWEEGVQVFEEWLLDADWSLNAGNWLWLSASAFFHQYFRVYSPIAFGKKTDANGDYIRKYIPKLKAFPKEYIYEPWKAPIALQKKFNCLIGVDYPKPIVEHETVRKINLTKMSIAYKSNKEESIEEEKGDVLVTPRKKAKK